MNLRIALLGVVTIGALLALPGMASAQRAALVQEIDDAARVPYQEGLTTSCSFAGDCAIIFSAVPAGRRRVVEQVSCIVTLASSGAVQTLALNATSFRNARAFLPVFASPGAPQIYVTNAGTLMFFEAGETPRIDAFTTVPTSLALCTLSGREISLP